MSIRERADAVLGESVSTDALPGVVAGATNRDGDLYLGGFGERVLGSGEEMTPDTVGWIASMTKAITTAAAMQLVEQGRLELDAPASEVVSGLGDTAVLEGFDGDGQVTGEVAPEVRLLRVLSGEMARLDIQEALGLKHEDHFRKSYLLPALQAGLIEMTIPDKPRSSKQRYRLTLAGSEYLKQIGDTR